MNSSDALTTKSALIIGSSGGIGGATVAVLRSIDRQWTVQSLSRSKDGFDITVEASIIQAAEAFLLEELKFDLIINATGMLEANGHPPEKSFSSIEQTAMKAVLATNAIGPALLFKHFSKFLNPRKKSVFATLSARVGSIGDNRLGGWMSYRASKAALNQIIRCAAIEMSRTQPNAIVVALHPGTIETALTQKYAKGRFTDTAQASAQKMLNVIDNLTVVDTGKFFDYAGNEIDW